MRDDEKSWREILRNARTEPVGLALAGLCNTDLESVKSKLLDAKGDEILVLQGEGQALRRILKYLTERPLPQPARFDKSVASNL